MPKNNVSDPITDQEIAFARLVLAGTMTDRRAAEAVGLHPASAAYTKSRPRVRAYMLEHRAAVQQQPVEQDTDGLRRLSPSRDQVLDRLWEIANLTPEMTRGSITGQVKALSMIIAIEGLIPDRRAAAAQNKPVPHPLPRKSIPPSGFVSSVGTWTPSRPPPLLRKKPPPSPNPLPAGASPPFQLPPPNQPLTLASPLPLPPP